MSTAKFDTLSNLAGTLTIPVDTVAQGTARAWVNFNGTGTVAIRAAFNVTSITDNGTGDYTVNFTTAMPDADYAAVPNAAQNGTTAVRNNVINAYVYSTTSVALVSTRASSAAFEDALLVSVAIFR
jgi:hypothetical protein